MRWAAVVSACLLAGLFLFPDFARAQEATLEPPPRESLKWHGWYEITRAGKHLGHRRILLYDKKVRGGDGFFIRDEWSITRPDTGAVVSSRLDGALGADYRPILMEGRLTQAGKHYVFRLAERVETDPEGRPIGAPRPVFERQLPDDSVIQQQLERVDFVLDSTLGLILAQQGRLRTAETVNFKLFSIVDRDEPFQEVSLAVTGQATRNYAGQNTPVFESALTFTKAGTKLEGFFFDASGTLREGADALQNRATHVKTRKEAMGGIDTFLLERRGRRDPFLLTEVFTPVDRDVKKVKPGEVTEGVKPESGLTEREIALNMEKARNLFQNAKGLAGLDPQPTDELIKLYREFQDILSLIRNQPKLTQVQLQEMLALNGEFEALIKPQDILLHKARAIFERMKLMFGYLQEAFNQKEFEELRKSLEELAKIANEKEMMGHPRRKEVLDLADDANELLKRADILREFSQVAGQIKIEGIIYYLKEQPKNFRIGVEILGNAVGVDMPIRVPMSKSVAILTGGSYAEGEAIPGVQGLSLYRVFREYIVLDYKGERFTLRLIR